MRNEDTAPPSPVRPEDEAVLGRMVERGDVEIVLVDGVRCYRLTVKGLRRAKRMLEVDPPKREGSDFVV